MKLLLRIRVVWWTDRQVFGFVVSTFHAQWMNQSITRRARQSWGISPTTMMMIYPGNQKPENVAIAVHRKTGRNDINLGKSI